MPKIMKMNYIRNQIDSFTTDNIDKKFDLIPFITMRSLRKTESNWSIGTDRDRDV